MLSFGQRVGSDLSVPMLHCIRMIDLTSHLSGPYCTWLLGTLGADVIKVERPDRGSCALGAPSRNGESLYFGSINRNKRSIILDLKVPTDADVLRELITKADVLVENMMPGALARLGFSRRHHLPAQFSTNLRLDQRLRPNWPPECTAGI